MERICFLVNYNLYESKRHFTQKLADALTRKGVETKIIDLQEGPLNLDIVTEIQYFTPDLTCSFNSFVPDSNGRFLWDLLQIPHLAILVDPAIYSLNLTKSPYSIISCVDRFDCKDIAAYQFDRVFFLPHAIEKEPPPPTDDRPYDVVYLGSCYDYESLRTYWREQLPITINAVLDNAIDIVFSDSYISLAQALTMAWGDAGLSHEGVDFVKLFYYLDQYTRGKDRVELIRQIRDRPVHIFGELMPEDPLFHFGWSHYLGEQSNVTFHPSVPFNEALQILKKTRVCLNSMPFFKNGTHERIFAAFAGGAVPLTSDSLYLDQEFCVGEDLLVYKPSERDLVNEQINHLLSDESRRQEMAAKGRAIVMERHTWDQRADQLIAELPAFLNRITLS